jgi:GR25 family glycosyltransferase involved in LPS biosynthesis
MVDCVYVMHYSKLTERKEHLLKNIKDVGLDKYPIIWVEHFDRENITPEMIQKNFAYQPHIMQRHLSMAEIANGIAHNYIIEQVASKHDIALILEDDIVLKDGFTVHLEKAIGLLPKDWDVLNIGGDYAGEYRNDPSPINCDVTIVPHNSCAITCSYVLKKSTAQKIMTHQLFRPFCLPIDTTLCYICPHIEAKTYWCRPWIAYEGSKTPLFQSSIFSDRGF